MFCPCGRRSVHRTSSYSDTETQPAARPASCRRTTWLQPALSGGPTVTHCCTIPTVICTCSQNFPLSVDSIDMHWPFYSAATRRSARLPQLHVILDGRDTADATRIRHRLLYVGPRSHESTQLNATLVGLNADFVRLQRRIVE